MPKFTLLSIKPQYAKQIYSGTKRFEYRRILPTHEDYPVLIYESSPVKKVTGVVSFVKYLTASPEELWSFSYRYAGISREDFAEYFKGTRSANAIMLFSVMRLDEPLNLGEHGLPNRPPQSFCYVDLPDFEVPKAL